VEEEASPPVEPEGTEAVEESETTPAAEQAEDAEGESGLESDAAPPASEGETGAGVGSKPGPEGPGFGAYSDADFPGADTFLSRVEAEVQRRFNFRGRGTGVVAEYHFYINRAGKIEDLLLMESSGIGSLDLAARSALMRSKFPPLPPGFRHDKLGVTYRFHDDK
jgi:outer membrane biosynthesis protein TonB